MSPIFYKYRAFSSLPACMLLEDRVYFARAEKLNDPLDCQPSVLCDVPNNFRLWKVVQALFVRTEAARVYRELTTLGIPKDQARSHSIESARSAIDVEYKCFLGPTATEEDEDFQKKALIKELQNLLHRALGVGVFSLSATCTNPLMWSHYGDEHRGFCVGYNLDRESPPDLHKVCYGGERSVRASLIERAFVGDGDLSAANDLEHLILLRKGQAWSYEEEYRCFSEPGEADSPFQLAEVVFGRKCPDSTVHLLRTALASRTDIQFFAIVADQDTFELNKRPMSGIELNKPRLPRTSLTQKETFQQLLGRTPGRPPI